MECNLERIKCWKQANPEGFFANQTRWHEANPEYRKRWCDANPERARDRTIRYYELNREREIRRSKSWHKANPERCRIYVSRAIKRSRKENPNLWALRDLCSSVNDRLRLGLEPGKVALLPYSPTEFIARMEFTAGMPFADAKALDYEVDHIIPVSYIHMLPLSAEEKFQIAQDLRNLQFIPQPENASKGDKILPEHLGFLYELLGCYQEAA